MRRFVKNLFRSNKVRAARGRKRTTVRLSVEGLEERSLMAAGLGLDLGPVGALGAVSQPVLSTTTAIVNQPAPALAPQLSVPANPIDYTPDTVFKLGNYWIDVPASYDPTHQTPTELFVWSHGAGGQSAGDIYNVHATAGGPTYITITIDGRENDYWRMDTDPQLVLDAIADVKTHFNIDPQRVVLGGYSSGGDLSYRVAFTHSTEIAGVLAENTSPFRDTGLMPDQALAAPFHFHIVHLAHTEDDTYPIDGVISEADAVKAAGLPGDGWATRDLIELPGSHYDDNTVSDLQTYLLPHLADGWTSPGDFGIGAGQAGIVATAQPGIAQEGTPVFTPGAFGGPGPLAVGGGAQAVALPAVAQDAAAVPPAAAAVPDEQAALNGAVWSYAAQFLGLGVSIGDGGCSRLVAAALQAAGAQFDEATSYWGTPIGLDQLMYGDVLQFEGAHFEHHYPDGSWYWQDFPHHSAIVYSVNGSQITLINQNVNGDTTVQLTTINLDDLTAGTILAYRPQA
jgi:hypothetical protein